MPERRTKRGAERTPLGGDYDVLICGASFAGPGAWLAELCGPTAPARVLMLDRYEVGERQTSACGIPTAWLEALDLMGSHRQTFGELVVTHAVRDARAGRCPGPSRRSTTRSSASCSARSPTASSRPPRSNGRTGDTVHTDRGDLSAPLIVDALGWRRVLAASGFQPPDAPLSRGLEVHPGGARRRPGDLDRPQDRARRLRLELPGRATSCASASARSTRAST